MSVSADVQVGVLPIEARFISDSRELEIELNNGRLMRGQLGSKKWMQKLLSDYLQPV